MQNEVDAHETEENPKPEVVSNGFALDHAPFSYVYS
jgi:hypothetical protein